MIAVDQRQSARVRVEFPVTVEIDHGMMRSWPARAVDISVDGILLWSTRPLRLNVPFVIHFPFEWERAFAIAAAVWRQEFIYGSQFINLPMKLRKSLERAVAEYLRQDRPKALTTLWRHL